MPNELRCLARQLLGITLLGVLPAVLAAFASLPYTLGHHPGERPAATAAGEPRHMT